MKKSLKAILVIIIILAVIAGGLYGGYRYSQSKKTAKVVSLYTYGMDGYWGDSIESYGTVTSEKSQTAYLSSGTEILSVNVSAGDHVNEGDVLMTVKKESQDIPGKELEVQKAQQTYMSDAATLARLQTAVPIPEYISSSPDTRTRTDEDGNEYEVVVGTFYYNAETGAIIGHEGVDEEGNIREKYRPPEGYKPSELKEIIEQMTLTVQKDDLDLRIKQNELEVMKNTNDDGNIVAKVSGTVSKVQNKDNYNSTQPFVIVTATDEYYISGSIGEFDLENIELGDTVSISSWDTGVTAEAIISYISDSPSTSEDNYYYSSGNSNISNYEFKATFDKSSGIEIGSSVNISITPSDAAVGGFYIPAYFIRKDSSGNYIMKMNEEGFLQKEYVQLGKTLWGEMTEIKSGVTMDDYLAFPYGNGEIEGIKCETVDSLDY